MRVLPLSHFAAVLPAAVTAERCATLRAWLTELGFSPTGNGYPAGYRDNDRLVRDDEALAREMWALPALQSALRELGPFTALGGRWLPVGANARFRACRYESGQSFTRHRDGAYSPVPSRRTFLTAQLYLDEGFVGGATRFYERRDDEVPSASVVPRQGTLIVFDHRAWHDGEAVTDGRKHVLRTDIVFERVSDEPELSAPFGRFDLPGAPYVFALLLRRDGTLAVGARDGNVTVLTLEGATPRAARSHSVGQSSVTALTEDAQRRLYAGSRRGLVKRIDNTGASIVWRARGAITSLCVDASGALLVGSADGALSRLSTDGAHQEWPLAGWIWGMSRSGDHTLIASEAGLFRLSGSSDALVLLDHKPIRAVAQDPRGRLFTGDARGFVCGPDSLSEQAHTGAVTALVSDEHGGFVSAGEDGAVVHGRPRGVGSETWHLERRSLHDDFARAIAVLADGSIASGGYDGAVRLSPPRCRR